MRAMARYVALLRAVNLGKIGKIAMADLRALLTSLECSNVQTLLQSGNAVFDSRARTPADVEKQLETELASRLGLETLVFARTPAQWTAIVKANPFAQMAKDDPGHLVVMVTRGKPKPTALAQLRAPGPEQIEVGEGCLYITYPEGIGRSKLTTNKGWRTLGAVGTARNWNTVQKIAAAL
jgi:uncharacterized protein (DUF1697 family)